MSTAQPPHHEEDSLQAPHADSQQADLIRSRDRVSGEKKAWARKARRRHSVATAKFTRHETTEASSTRTTHTVELETLDIQKDSSLEEQTEGMFDTSTNEELSASDAIVDNDAASDASLEEEVVEELEVVEEQPEQADEEQPKQVDENSLDSSDEDFLEKEAAEDPSEETDDLNKEEASAEDDPEGMKPTEDVPEDEKLTEDGSENNSNEEADQELADGGEEEPESDAEDSVSDSVEETSEEVAEEAAEDSEEATEDLDEYVDELSRELDAIEESEAVEEEPENELPAEPMPVDDSPGNEQEEEIVEELEIQRERIPHRQADLQARSWDAPFKHDAPARQKPTKRSKPAPAPAPALVERPQPTKREKPKPASAPMPTPAADARQKPTKRKKTVPRYRYIKSPSLEQAFRNLLRLDAGEAWRATRIPLVTFFLCFALLALAVVDQAPAIDSVNAAINAFIHGARGALDSFFVAITMLGDLLPMTALCLVVCAILAIARKWDSFAFFTTNVILAVVCVQALKFIFAVPRPGAETLVPIPGSFSFPSAHSFCSLIVFGMIGLLIFRALNRKGVSYNVAIVPGIILVIFAILIGISRIYVGVHWPSDVLGGWLLAGMWLPFASALYTVGARKVVSSKAAEEQFEQ